MNEKHLVAVLERWYENYPMLDVKRYQEMKFTINMVTETLREEMKPTIKTTMIKPKAGEETQPKTGMGVKYCRRCGKILPIESFNKRKLSSDGLQLYCRKCQSKQMKQSRKNKKKPDYALNGTGEGKIIPKTEKNWVKFRTRSI